MTNDLPPREEVLYEAARLITGDRNVSYGTPTQNFTNIAEFWTTRFKHKLKDFEEFTATDVADAMMLLKIARNITDTKRDNYVDLAGYAGCGWEAAAAESAPAEAFQPPKLQITVNNPPGACATTSRKIQEMLDDRKRPDRA